MAELKASDGKCIQMTCVVMMGMKRVTKVKVSKGESQKDWTGNCFPESESIGTYSSVFLFQSSQYKDLNNSQYIRRFLLSSLVIYNCE